MILFKMKKLAEDYLGHPVTKAVITVPSYFNNSQRQATKDAGQIAGLEVLRIISEPTAAALAYGLKARSLNEGRQNLLVFDLGGGTFDVTVLVIEGGIFDVRATAGDTHLGGEDFDNRLVELGVSKFAQTHGGRNLKTNKRALRRLRNACEQAKLALSTAERTSVELDSLFEGLDLRFDVERAQFEDICDDLFRKTLEHVGRALSDSGLAKQDIHQVLLVGGSTRIPKVQQLLRQYFGREDLNLSINPDEAVARGAAVQAAMLCGEASMGIRDVLDVTPLSLGTALVTGDFSVIIGRNTRIPTTQTGNYYTVHPKQNAALIEVSTWSKVWPYLTLIIVTRCDKERNRGTRTTLCSVSSYSAICPRRRGVRTTWTSPLPSTAMASSRHRPCSARRARAARSQSATIVTWHAKRSNE